MPVDEWSVDALDLAGYLERIGHDRPDEPTVEALASLHRAHVVAIPFENLDVILGRTVSVELPDIQAKLVGARRGGYCYEHGLLFGAVLSRLGFSVQRLLARVGDDLERPRARTHLTLFVTVDGDRFLSDVGFGSGPLGPVPLAPDRPVTQGRWTYRMSRAQDVWLLQERTEDSRWATQYSVAEQPLHFADVVMSNHFTSTYPQSPFVSRPVVVRKDEDRQRRLLGREFTVISPGSDDEARVISDDEYPSVLHDLGLDLDPSTVNRLIATLPGDRPV